jgi:hypothetical protein
VKNAWGLKQWMLKSVSIYHHHTTRILLMAVL